MALAYHSLRRCMVSSVYKQFRSRSIGTSAINMEKALEKLEKNPYYDKYAQRIAQLQKTSPEEFLQRVESVEKASKAEPKTSISPPDTRQYSSVLNPKQSLTDQKAPAGEKKLDDVMKLELVQDKNAEEIHVIWEEYHKNKEVISAIIPHNVYEELKENMQKYPTFLFPLPRSQGYEFIMSQCYGNTVHFTPLLAYQVHKENAPECLTMIHYTELKDKGLVLMRGEYDKNVLNGKEAQCLANQFQMYYNGKNAAKYQILQTFTEKPDAFKHMDLVSQLENIGLV